MHMRHAPVARKQIHLAAYFPGSFDTTLWTDPACGSMIEFESFERFARTAERGRFDFVFLPEELSLRERHGRIYDQDVAGRPDNLTVLAALAAVTDRIGLASTSNTTFNEPYELARQIASLDHLSGGRAAWNVVTSHTSVFGRNFRRGTYLPKRERYERAAEFVAVARALWDSHPADEGRFAHPGRHFGIRGAFTVPRGPQGHPVLIQAGSSDEGREFAAAAADVVFSLFKDPDNARAFNDDVKGRLARLGRRGRDLKGMPGASFVLGATPEEARERAEVIRHQQVRPQGALAFLEKVWRRDLSSYDPYGPLPDIPPKVRSSGTARFQHEERNQMEIVARWRRLSEERNLNIHQLVVELRGRQPLVGTPAQVAELIHRYVQSDVCDGFVLLPHLLPDGFDEFVDTVVPLLQERGSFRADYTGSTLRDHLSLPWPDGRSG